MNFNPLHPDAFTMYVMQSSEYKDKVLESAARFMRQGVPAGPAVAQAMNWERVDQSDFTHPDWAEIEDFIEENS